MCGCVGLMTGCCFETSVVSSDWPQFCAEMPYFIVTLLPYCAVRGV